MFMDILKRKGVCRTFLCVKTHRDSLDGANIVDGTFLFKICQRNMPCCLVYIDGCDRRWNFLNQCKAICQISFIGAVDELL